MTAKVDGILRAIKERGEKGITDPLALSALGRMVDDSKRATFDDWIRKVGRDNALRLWRDHFGDEAIPGDGRD